MPQRRPFSFQTNRVGLKKHQPHTCSFVKHFHQREVNVAQIHWLSWLLSFSFQHSFLLVNFKIKIHTNSNLVVLLISLFCASSFFLSSISLPVTLMFPVMLSIHLSQCAIMKNNFQFFKCRYLLMSFWLL